MSTTQTQKFSIPGRLNLGMAAGLCVLFLAGLFACPLLPYPWLIALAILASLPFNTPLWSLIHEAIHKNFYPDKRVNEIAGRGLSVLFGAAFGVLRFGHLMHHQYNRDWENEYYTGSKLLAWARHYFTMLGGLYMTEIAMSFLIACLPALLSRKVARAVFADDRHYQAVLNSLLKPSNVTAIRIDCLVIALLYGAAFYVSAWVAFTLIGRGLIISLMDNSYHYGTPLDGSVAAKELTAPRGYSRFILNFNFHRTHHDHVGVPWSGLAELHAANGTPYAESLGAAVAEQFKGPILKR